VLNILIFNLRYAVIDGRTYSIASVDGASWLIIYGATTSAIGLIIGWLVPMVGLRAFSNNRQKATNITVGYIWLTLYLLALPILLNFAINGITVTWALPEWYILFIGLLCLIQAMVVAFVGLILTGVIAGIVRITRRPAFPSSN
jgi:hypothetical protein